MEKNKTKPPKLYRPLPRNGWNLFFSKQGDQILVSFYSPYTDYYSMRCFHQETDAVRYINSMLMIDPTLEDKPDYEPKNIPNL